jgi:hypothetical protein
MPSMAPNGKKASDVSLAMLRLMCCNRIHPAMTKEAVVVDMQARDHQPSHPQNMAGTKFVRVLYSSFDYDFI